MRASIVVFLFILTLGSCRDKVICPAFQSTYILDDSTRYAYYSYVWKLDDEARQQYFGSLKATTDSLASDSGVFTTETDKMMPYYAYAEQIVPPLDPVQKTKFGIVKYEPFWLKNYKLRTAPMENIRGPEPEEEKIVDEGEFIASDFQTDSIRGDSTVQTISDSTLVGGRIIAETARKKKERKYLYRYREDDDFNVEQEYYNKYFGEKLVDNRPPPPEVEEDELDSLSTEKRSFLDFIKDLFSKKEVSTDSTSVEELGADFLPPSQPADSVQQN